MYSYKRESAVIDDFAPPPSLVGQSWEPPHPPEEVYICDVSGTMSVVVSCACTVLYIHVHTYDLSDFAWAEG